MLRSHDRSYIGMKTGPLMRFGYGSKDAFLIQMRIRSIVFRSEFWVIEFLNSKSHLATMHWWTQVFIFENTGCFDLWRLIMLYYWIFASLKYLKIKYFKRQILPHSFSKYSISKYLREYLKSNPGCQTYSKFIATITCIACGMIFSGENSLREPCKIFSLCPLQLNC